MANNQQKQAPADVKPVKKRRFFRPKTKPTTDVILTSTPEANQPNLQKKAKANKPKVEKSNKPSTAQNKTEPAKKTTVLEKVKKAARKTTPKNNSNFKPRRPAGQPRLKLTDINFKYLDTPQFKDIYALVTKAQSYFENDKETCCTKFRIANEAIISRLIKKLQLTEAVDETNYFEQINLLSKNISSEMADENIFAEMHNIRMIGNSFAHGDDKYSPANGSKTCLIAMEKICRWLVNFEPKYDSYQRAKAATKSSTWSDIINGIKKIPSSIMSFFSSK